MLRIMFSVFTLFLAHAATGQPQVPNGFTATRIAPLLDGRIPELEAIDDPDFGTGVLSATLNNGIATVRLIEPQGIISELSSWIPNQLGAPGSIKRIRLDSTGVVERAVHVTLYPGVGVTSTQYFTLDQSGEATSRWLRTDEVLFDFDITAGIAGNPVGVALLDGDGTLGTQLAWMDGAYHVTVVDVDSNPNGRTDTDVFGLRLDVSGRYGGGVLLADTDANTDGLTAIYEVRDVLAGGNYRLIGSTVPATQRQYGDLSIAASGVFGNVIYITERITNQIQQVDTSGVHTTWATGFNGIDSLSISPDGMSMYVGDLSGVWLIQPEGNRPGPAVITTDPSAGQGTTFGGAPVDAIRVVFTEPVNFTQQDVQITNNAGEDVPFAVNGSGSQFMLIALGIPLSGDTYTLTLLDAASSAITGVALDGDSDGVAGGVYTTTFLHVCEADQNSDGMLNGADFNAWLSNFALGCR